MSGSTSNPANRQGPVNAHQCTAFLRSAWSLHILQGWAVDSQMSSLPWYSSNGWKCWSDDTDMQKGGDRCDLEVVATLAALPKPFWNDSRQLEDLSDFLYCMRNECGILCNTCTLRRIQQALDACNAKKKEPWCGSIHEVLCSYSRNQSITCSRLMKGQSTNDRQSL